MADDSWFVYMLRCSDNSLYTGITKDIERRVLEHNSGAGGAKYTRTRKPVTLVYLEPGPTRSAVCQRECQIKKMNVAQKNNLIANYS
jgi:putative endonuclease